MTTLTYDYENIRFTCFPMGNRTDQYVVNARRISDGKSINPLGGRTPGIRQAIFQSDEPPTQEFFEQVCQYKILEAIGNFEPEPTLCYACDKPLPSDDDTDYQFDNALWIELHGGYGMFVDEGVGNRTGPYGLKGPRGEYVVVICHECAHELCETVPFFAKLIQPHRSHAHRTDTIPALLAAGHQGWDLDRHYREAAGDDGERDCADCGESFNVNAYEGEDFNVEAGGPLCRKCIPEEGT